MRNYTYLGMAKNGRLFLGPEGNILRMPSMSQNESNPVLPMIAIEFMALFASGRLLGAAMDKGIVKSLGAWPLVIGTGIGIAFYITVKKVICYDVEHASCKPVVLEKQEERTEARGKILSLAIALSFVAIVSWVIVIALAVKGNPASKSVRLGLPMMWFAATFATLFLEPRERWKAFKALEENAHN